MPRVPCLDNLTVSREYNGRIFGNVTRNAFGKLTAGRLWIVVVARPNSSIDVPICGPLFIQWFIQFCISLARFFSTSSDCLNVSQSLFTTPPSLVGQTNYPMFTSSRQWNIFKSYFSTSRLFILVRNELFDVIRYFFETQRNIFRLYFSTFRLFVLV